MAAGHSRRLQREREDSRQLQVFRLAAEGEDDHRHAARVSTTAFSHVRRVDTWAANGNWALNSTTFAEVTYGRSRQPQSGCALATQGTAPIYCATGFPADDVANPANIGLGALPLIFPNSGAFDPRYLATKLLQQAHTPVYQNNQVLIAPTFVWGNRVANAPPNTPFPGIRQSQRQLRDERQRQSSPRN